MIKVGKAMREMQVVIKGEQSRLVRGEIRSLLREGMRDGLPIGLGYFAAAFSLGIAARGAGLSAIQGFVASMLCNASAGQYAGFSVIAQGAPYIEIVIVTFIANARYLLMSCALGQRMEESLPLRHRLMVGYDITDELFGLAIARPGFVNPYYTYGAILVAIPCWASGTAMGIMAGNVLPLRAVSAFSVALYGMFIAIIIPPAKKDRVIGCLIGTCFLVSYGMTYIAPFSNISSGLRTIILTVVLSVVAALVAPVQTTGESIEKVEGTQ